MNCCANLSNLVIYRALLSDPIVNALRRPKEFFAPELEGLLLVAAEEKVSGLYPLLFRVRLITPFAAICTGILDIHLIRYSSRQRFLF